MFRRVLTAYDPTLSLDDAFRQRLPAFTLLHRFGAEIVDGIWRKRGRPFLNSLPDLQRLLFPPI